VDYLPCGLSVFSAVPAFKGSRAEKLPVHYFNHKKAGWINKYLNSGLKKKSFPSKRTSQVSKLTQESCIAD